MHLCRMEGPVVRALPWVLPCARLLARLPARLPACTQLAAAAHYCGCSNARSRCVGRRWRRGARGGGLGDQVAAEGAAEDHSGGASCVPEHWCVRVSARSCWGSHCWARRVSRRSRVAKRVRATAPQLPASNGRTRARPRAWQVSTRPMLSKSLPARGWSAGWTHCPCRRPKRWTR